MCPGGQWNNEVAATNALWTLIVLVELHSDAGYAGGIAIYWRRICIFRVRYIIFIVAMFNLYLNKYIVELYLPAQIQGITHEDEESL